MRQPSNPIARLALVALVAWSTAASAGTVNVRVDAASPWVGYMNVYELPASPATDRGGYVFGQDWGSNIAALPASVSGNVVTMTPNATYAPDTNDPFWWTPDGSGGVTPNKVIEANLYVDSGFAGPLAGQTVRFTGITSANSLAAPYVAYAFIREFELNYGNMINQDLVQLVAGQAFELQADTTAGNAVQYGFALVGPNADLRTVQSLGSISMSAVPEPATLAMVLLGALAAVAARSRRRA